MKIKKILLLFILLIVLSSYSCKKISESNNQANVNNDIIDNNSPEEVGIFSYGLIMRSNSRLHGIKANIDDYIYNQLSAKYNKKIYFWNDLKVFEEHLDAASTYAKDNDLDFDLFRFPIVFKYIFDNNPSIKIMSTEPFFISLLQDYFVELYDLDTNTGLLESYNDYKTLYSDTAINNKLYSVSFKNSIYPSLLAYDSNLVKNLGLEDPQELFYSGKWDIDTFLKYLTYKVPTDKLRYQSTFTAADLFSNLLASQGELLFDNGTKNYNLNDNRLSTMNSIIDKLSDNCEFSKTGTINSYLLSNFFYIYDSLFLTKNNLRLVPYPIDSFELINEPYSYINGFNETVQVDKPISYNGENIKVDEKEVYGIDFKNTKSISLEPIIYQYGIVDKEHKNSELDNKLYLNIISDLDDMLYSNANYSVSAEDNDSNANIIKMMMNIQRFDWSTSFSTYANYVTHKKISYVPHQYDLYFSRNFNTMKETGSNKILDYLSICSNKMYNIIFNTSPDDWKKGNFDISDDYSKLIEE